MVRVARGRFRMGSEDFYAEESPVRSVDVDGFWIDHQPVTVRAFRRFVATTGYVTVAERPPDPAAYPGADPAPLVPGSLVFRMPPQPVALDDYTAWWHYVPGACWRHPAGPSSGISGRDRHPVTHVAYADAVAYADWAGKALPNEAEWEYAARGGLDGARFAWGEEEQPSGELMANTWQGRFPTQNLHAKGYERTSPVGAFPPNRYGLYDMIGNVWEWTSTDFEPARAADGCCVAATEQAAPARQQPAAEIPRMAIKGGSHLCAPNYCLRYRPAARQGEPVDTSTSHLGFRCVSRS
ncbi:MAG: hypothetical protein JWQ48_1385 [Conexibacter sp.]|nr:hypothetical protein [Conexibacter sp.]